MDTVLYIEDNPLNMRLVKKHLKKVGIPMLEAVDGLKGIKMAISEKPSVILVDVNLPDMDGLEVTRRLKANEEVQHIPVIALTANAMHGDRERCLDAGCDGYLPKPIARQELYNVLRQYLPDSFAVTA